MVVACRRRCTTVGGTLKAAACIQAVGWPGAGLSPVQVVLGVQDRSFGSTCDPECRRTGANRLRRGRPRRGRLRRGRLQRGNTWIDNKYRRGYTEHEHLNKVDLDEVDLDEVDLDLVDFDEADINEVKNTCRDVLFTSDPPLFVHCKLSQAVYPSYPKALWPRKGQNIAYFGVMGRVTGVVWSRATLGSPPSCALFGLKCDTSWGLQRPVQARSGLYRPAQACAGLYRPVQACTRL